MTTQNQSQGGDALAKGKIGADGCLKHNLFEPSRQALNTFSESMAEHGLSCPDAIIPDGKIHRFYVAGDKPKSKNGWYVFYGNDDLPAGSYGSWKLNQTFTWCRKGEKSFSAAERAKWQEQIAKAKKARDQEQKRIHLEAKKKAAWIWEHSKPITDYPYLVAKGVKSYGLRLYKDSLVVPILDTDNTIHNLQFVSADGDKNFLSGGAIRSYFFIIDGDGNTLLVCEGYATAASLHEATGYPVVIAFNAGNLNAVTEILHKKSPDIKLIICADDDCLVKDNPGLTKAKKAAAATGAALAIPAFKNQTHRGTDFNDLHQIEGIEAVRLQIEDALKTPASQDETTFPSSDITQKTIEHLATLAPFEYDQQRQSIAEKLGIRVGTLDAEVEKLRKANSPDKGKSLVEDLEPWPEPVSGAEILDTIHKVALDYVIMPEKSAVAFSLWCLLTYCYNAFRILPVLEIKSPEKRCGKTRLLEVLSGLAYRAFPSSNLTPATVYRVIEKCQPCFLIDEADTFLPQNDELRGVLNSGHTVKNAFVTRCNSETNEPERFSTWCPKAIALIGKLPSTLDDRAIVISLKRKLTTEAVKRLSLSFDDECLDLRRKCKRWATDNMGRLKAANPELPAIDNDRALDNWTPLLAIADLAGGEWPKSARNAMQEIEAGKEDDSARVMLLQDIQKIFKDRACEKLSSQNLVDALVAIEDRPWSEWKRGKPLSKVGLSRLLKPFNIAPNTIRIGEKTAKGYYLKHLVDDFNRYLPSANGFSSVTTSQPAPDQGLSDYSNVTDKMSVTSSNGLKPACIKGCDVVTDEKGDLEEEDIKVPEPLPNNSRDREVTEI